MLGGDGEEAIKSGCSYPNPHNLERLGQNSDCKQNQADKSGSQNGTQKTCDLRTPKACIVRVKLCIDQ
jgi:hypothetical protein